MSRTSNAIKNIGFGLLGRIINLILSFILRTVFIYFLGATYLGINGLYSEILTLLSFAELGFGNAMIFAMYKPVSENNTEKIIKLLKFYKKVYRFIAFFILILGICLVPFLQYIVKKADWLSIRELRIYFIIFLINTIMGYFVTYKFSYLNALQKNYININIDTIINIISHCIQIIIIFLFKNFLFYLLVNSFILIISRILIVIYLNKKYPIFKLKTKEELSKREKKYIYKEVQGLMVHQFSSVIVHSTDNILISMISGLGIIAVGYISNYNMLMNSILNFVAILFNSITSGFGNLVASSTPDNYHKVFKEINFINFWIYGFCSICFWLLIPPFIMLWIGEEKLIDSISFSLIVLNCYLQGQSGAFNNARIAKGNFGKDKKWAFIQAITNLLVSIIAGYYLGLVGIYIGTIISRLIYVIFRPYSTYKFLFQKSSREYYEKFIQYFLVTIFTAIILKIITFKLLILPSIKIFIVTTILIIFMINLFFGIIFFKSQEMENCKRRILNILNVRRKRI